MPPLSTGLVYLGPTPGAANGCRCSSVFYSLISACASCQSDQFLKCVHLAIFNTTDQITSNDPSGGRRTTSTVLRCIQECALLSHILHSTVWNFLSFPFDIPAGTKVPHWAYLDVVVSLDSNFVCISLRRIRQVTNSSLWPPKQLLVRDLH